MKKTLLSLIVVLCCADSCDKAAAPDKDIEVDRVPKEMVEGGRFHVERHGVFRAGHDNNEREILIITDEQTHRRYLGITGVGVTELYVTDVKNDSKDEE